jgi:simple sugar transport system permease protein
LNKKITQPVSIVGLGIVVFVISMVGVAAVSEVSVKDVFVQFIESTIGTESGILNLLERTGIVLMVSLGLSIAFGSGVWNLGGEGQILWGGLIAVGIALFLNMPFAVVAILAFVCSFLVAGTLKARWNVNEMVATLMLNFVALASMIQVAGGPWRDPLVLIPKTLMIADAMRFPFIRYPLSSTFLVSLAFVPIVYVLMNKTVIGYEMRAVGSRPSAAAYSGIRTGRITLLCMFLSGGVIALTGSMLVFGHFFRAESGMTGAFGFYAIVSTLLGRNKPQYMPLTSFLLALIITGTNGLRVMGIPGPFTDLVIGLLFIIGVIPEIYSRRL